MNWRSAFIGAVAAATSLALERSSEPSSGLAVMTHLSDQQLVEVAPSPRLAFIYTSFAGRVIEIGKDSITVQGFQLMTSSNIRPEIIDPRKRRLAWTPRSPDKTFSLYFAPLGPMQDIMGEVKLFNNGVDSGPGWEMAATRAVWTRQEITITHPDGKVTILRLADEPPRTFPVEWSYTVGVVPDGLRTPETYRPSDLRVGDEVRLRFRHDLGQGTPNIVHGITIERRPGGQIPLAPGEDPKWGIRDRQQAYQDFEEKGTPIPWKFLSPQEQEERIAPPPREVLPHIPPVKD